MNIEQEIINTFEQEFRPIIEKFDLITFPVTKISKERNPYRAGVYVFFKHNRVWKIGKSYSNTIKRALEHFKADTGHGIGKGMKQFETHPSMFLTLILIKSEDDIHWILAVECFLETQFRKSNVLEIHSARL